MAVSRAFCYRGAAALGGGQVFFVGRDTLASSGATHLGSSVLRDARGIRIYESRRWCIETHGTPKLAVEQSILHKIEFECTTDNKFDWRGTKHPIEGMTHPRVCETDALMDEDPPPCLI